MNTFTTVARLREMEREHEELMARLAHEVLLRLTKDVPMDLLVATSVDVPDLVKPDRAEKAVILLLSAITSGLVRSDVRGPHIAALKHALNEQIVQLSDALAEIDGADDATERAQELAHEEARYCPPDDGRSVLERRADEMEAHLYDAWCAEQAEQLDGVQS